MKYIISGMQPCSYGLRMGTGTRNYLSMCNNKGNYMGSSRSLFCLGYEYVLQDSFSHSDLIACKYLDEHG